MQVHGGRTGGWENTVGDPGETDNTPLSPAPPASPPQAPARPHLCAVTALLPSAEDERAAALAALVEALQALPVDAQVEPPGRAPLRVSAGRRRRLPAAAAMPVPVRHGRAAPTAPARCRRPAHHAVTPPTKP